MKVFLLVTFKAAKGPSELKSRGAIAPLDCGQNISKNLHLQKPNRLLIANLNCQTFLRPCFPKRSPSILKGKENSISSFIHRQKRKLFNTFLRKSCARLGNTWLSARCNLWAGVILLERTAWIGRMEALEHDTYLIVSSPAIALVVPPHATAAIVALVG